MSFSHANSSREDRFHNSESERSESSADASDWANDEQQQSSNTITVDDESASANQSEQQSDNPAWNDDSESSVILTPQEHDRSDQSDQFFTVMKNKVIHLNKFDDKTKNSTCIRMFLWETETYVENAQISSEKWVQHVSMFLVDDTANWYTEVIYLTVMNIDMIWETFKTHLINEYQFSSAQMKVMTDWFKCYHSSQSLKIFNKEFRVNYIVAKSQDISESVTVN